MGRDEHSHAARVEENTRSTVRKIVETRNPISAPAPSLDRIEIFYNRFDSVVISPEDKTGLIAELIKLNPDIEVVYRSPYQIEGNFCIFVLLAANVK